MFGITRTGAVALTMSLESTQTLLHPASVNYIINGKNVDAPDPLGKGCVSIVDYNKNQEVMQGTVESSTCLRDSCMLYPLGDSHSNRNMVKVAAWIATTPTNIQDAVSNGSKKAVGDMIPVLFATTIAIPVSMNGTLKSTCNNKYTIT